MPMKFRMGCIVNDGNIMRLLCCQQGTRFTGNILKLLCQLCYVLWLCMSVQCSAPFWF